jgi:hypothetical protein
MRSLWPIERAALEAAIHDYPSAAECLERQIESAHVVDFKNTGEGFFSTVDIASDAPLLPDKSPLDAAYGTVEGIECQMGFLIFVKNGRVSLIEGYTFGLCSTDAIDFEHVQFETIPWSVGSD